MVIGLLRLRLHLPAAHSLKDRRAVVRRAADRVRARFNVSIAEVGDQERWQVATLAVSAVSTERGHVSEVLDKVTAAVASAVAGEALVTGREVVIAVHPDDEVLAGGNEMDDASGLMEKFGGSEEG
ncbi:MAG: DUF503 family protein [Deltaproteobacteria bacterium]|jgi:uncharacterized protein YlxP (DUF503 family)|nr:DUF503 family protein [Deltaproteobacteria bacterium]